MRSMKMLGLAVVAALAAMAAIGAGGASASVLCDSAPNGSGACAEGHSYEAGQEIQLVAKNGVLANSQVSYTCAQSQIQSTITDAGSSESAVLASIESLTLTGCSSPIGTCTIESQNLPYQAEVNALTKGNGTFRLKSGGYGTPQLKMACGGFFACTLNIGEPTLPLSGGNPASVTANKLTLPVASGLCPGSNTWTAKYVATSPTAIYAAGS